MIELATWLALHHCSLACASGIIANFEAEVGPKLDPCTISPSYAGLPQLLGPRKRRLLAMLGESWCNSEKQLEFVVAELRELKLLDRLFAMTDPSQAAKLFMLSYEKPRNRNPHHRMTRAREIFRLLKDTPSAR